MHLFALVANDGTSPLVENIPIDMDFHPLQSLLGISFSGDLLGDSRSRVFAENG